MGRRAVIDAFVATIISVAIVVVLIAVVAVTVVAVRIAIIVNGRGPIIRIPQSPEGKEAIGVGVPVVIVAIIVMAVSAVAAIISAKYESLQIPVAAAVVLAYVVLIATLERALPAHA